MENRNKGMSNGFHFNEPGMPQTPTLSAPEMGTTATLNGGTQKHNGNPTDELQGKYFGFYFPGQNARALRGEVTREEKN